VSGLLANGRRVLIPGIEVIGPGDAVWSKLDPRDYRLRPRGTWVRQVIIHTTKGLWPQYVKPGVGPNGRDRSTAEYWSGNPESGGAHIVVDSDGSIVCLCDLAKVEAYHATTSNAWSIGIEMYQESDGGIYEAVLQSTVALVRALCSGHGAVHDDGSMWEGFKIPFQIPQRRYNGRPIERMREHGGPDMVGVFGHRDNSWKFPWQLTPEQRIRYPNGYASRGAGDPGEEIYSRLRVAGAEEFDFDARQDLTTWKTRQVKLNTRGAKLDVDGVAGPATMSAIARLGLDGGRAVDVL